MKKGVNKMSEMYTIQDALTDGFEPGSCTIGTYVYIGDDAYRQWEYGKETEDGFEVWGFCYELVIDK
jgi:hypothetical protein